MKKLLICAVLLLTLTVTAVACTNTEDNGNGTGAASADVTDPANDGTGTPADDATNAPAGDATNAPADQDTNAPAGEVTTAPAPVIDPNAPIPTKQYLGSAYVDVTNPDQFENYYAKMNGAGTSVSMNDVDGGGQGGLVDVELHYCAEPNQTSTFEVYVNDELQYSFRVDTTGGGWFDAQVETFRLTLAPGLNTVTIMNVDSVVSHLEYMIVSAAESGDEPAETNPSDEPAETNPSDEPSETDPADEA